MDTHVVILAAGKGTRMKSARPKVLHRVAGRPMIEHVLACAAALNPASTTIVIGHQADALEQALVGHPGLTFVVQEPQLGTAHALMATESTLLAATGTLVLLSGDVPLLSAETLKTLIDCHVSTGAAATVVTAVVEQPRGYGRIVRSGQQIARIVEERDATSAEREIREINSGIYAFSIDGLFDAMRSVATNNAQREYYLPDLVAIYRQRGLDVETVTVSNADEIRGINSRIELAAVSRIVRDKKTAELMTAGVTIEDPATAYIDGDVTIGADTIVHPGVSLEGRTTIGAGCEIHSGARIVDSHIGDRVTIFNHCVITNARVADDVNVGPFAHLRQEADVRERARVGNFVELKKTVLGAGSKSMHLAYLGDATIGEKVNIGAGTITCNYDGTTKQQTIIEDGAFIGSDTQLIAPVTVGRGAYVGSGSTIRGNVPAGALAVSAGKQRTIEDWVEDRRKKREARTRHEAPTTKD
jgi:bifunctional UDP-N-acetylglucosamine pyrophosphorylase/glucosamine-1-phosphate N-acetyltransferase